MQRLLTRDEAADIIRKPVSWLRYAERRRLIPVIKIGQHVRYLEADLAAWIASCRTTARAGSTGGTP